MAAVESKVNFARWRATLDARVKFTGVIMDLESGEDKEHYLPQTGGWYLLTGHNFPDQTGQDDFEFLEPWSARIFALVSRFKRLDLLVFTLSCCYVQYPMPGKKKLSMLLCLEQLTSTVYSVFVGMGTCRMENVAGVALTVHDTSLISSLRATTRNTW